jgi:septal ring factor EnvC (AmiA/AmiB activator)
MALSEEKQKILDTINDLDNQIDRMHSQFHKYHTQETKIRPDWARLESKLRGFSGQKIIDIQISGQLDRVLYKFQNRKKIWLSWIE